MQRASSPLPTTIPLCLALAAGCVVDPDQPDTIDALDEDIDPLDAEYVDPSTEEPPREVGLATGAFSVEVAGAQSSILAAESTHFCVLAGISGDLTGFETGAGVYPVGGNWVLETDGNIWASTSCVLRSSFDTYENLLRSVFGMPPLPIARWASTAQMDATVMPNSGCDSDAGNTWWGDAATTLSAIAGRLHSSSDSASVGQGPTHNTPGQVVTSTCKPAWEWAGVWAAARSLYVGDLAATHYPAVFHRLTPGGQSQIGHWYDIPDVIVATSGGHQSQALGRTDRAMCFLTEIGGQFDALTQSAWLDVTPDPGGDRWTLHVDSSAGKYVWASARCYSYIQGLDLSAGPMNW